MNAFRKIDNGTLLFSFFWEIVHAKHLNIENGGWCGMTDVVFAWRIMFAVIPLAKGLLGRYRSKMKTLPLAQFMPCMKEQWKKYNKMTLVWYGSSELVRDRR